MATTSIIRRIASSPKPILIGLVATTCLWGSGCTGLSADSSGKGFGILTPSASRGYAPNYTILCMSALGAEGANDIEFLARGLRMVEGLNAEQVRIDRQGNKSDLYYGTYRGEAHKLADQFTAPASAKRDLALIRSLVYGQSRPFLTALIVDMPTPDVGPSEWHLRNAPGMYSLQITYCFDKPGMADRKEVAVAICRALREQGEEAWYYHDRRASIVAVGHFDASAVIRTPDGKMRYSDAVIRLQNKREEFKYNTECLLKVYRTVGGQRIAAQSILIQIARESVNEPIGPTQRGPGPAGY